MYEKDVIACLDVYVEIFGPFAAITTFKTGIFPLSLL
jgi:hypothetical protein